MEADSLFSHQRATCRDVRRGIALLLGIALWLAPDASAQAINVVLSERTPTDDSGIHVLPMSRQPSETLALPDVDTSGARFLEVFYSWEIEDDETVSVMVLPGAEGERLYIDLNNNEDLTDDGPPHAFRATENAHAFYLTTASDPESRAGRLLQRVPHQALTDSAFHAWYARAVVDEGGNLKPALMMMAPSFSSDFKGEKGSFYFDDRLHLSRGHAQFDSTDVPIGLLDYNENGRFDDEKDLFLVDLDGNGKLEFRSEAEVFKLDDVFEVAGARYRISRVDPQGASLQLEPTKEDATAYYLREWAEEEAEAGAAAEPGGFLEEAFWDLELETLEGERLRLADLRGRYVLLNFWGEWCAPCLDELPALAAARAEIPHEKLEMISLLLTHDRAQAQALIEAHGMGWPQVELTDGLAERFKVRSYPTNLLILPDGATYLRASGVSERFFERHVR